MRYFIAFLFINGYFLFIFSQQHSDSNLKISKQVEKIITQCEKKFDHGDLVEARFLAEKAFGLIKKHHLFDKHLNIFVWIGNINESQGDYPKALENYFKYLNLAKKNKDYTDIAAIYMSIANVLDYQDKTEDAEKYYKKAIYEYTKSNDLNGLADCYYNLSVLNYRNDEINEAISHVTKSLNIAQQAKYPLGVALAQSQLGFILFEKNETKRGLALLDSAFVYYKQYNDKQGLIEAYNNYAFIEVNNENYTQARHFLNKALKVAKLTDSKESIINIYRNITNLDSVDCNKLKKTKSKLTYIQALETYIKDIKTHSYYKEHVYNQENRKKILEQQISFDYKQKQIKLKYEQEKQNAIHKEEKNRQRIIIYAISLFLILILFFSRQLYKRLKLIRSQKLEIEQANNELAHKNKEITDSITYAKRIQSAILPQPKLVKEFLEDSFILYKPKDIVAGDFYWLEVVGDTVLFAAADCTGHGVPGAMVSVVCNNGLNRAVREHQLVLPDQILNKTRDLVIEEFEKSDEEVKDGMDISLCALNTQTNKLQWAGANNPLWILRNGEMIEYKADKQPIGKHIHSKSFNLVEIELKERDIIYIFTDGFQDQFGGQKQKKFRVAQMKELFLSLTDKSMEEQRKMIDETFETWKGDLEQIDDVCLIGVRI